MPLPAFVQRMFPVLAMSSRTWDILADWPEEEPSLSIPAAPFLTARKSSTGQRLPQSVAHRGFKIKYPENTLLALQSAVLDAGANGLETDIHLTRDEVVVLSHDATLLRCFGQKDRVVDLSFSELRKCRTIREPHLPMPKLEELLEFLAEQKPGREDVWLLLDIKVDNNPRTVMKRIAETIRSVPAHPNSPWEKRIVMGVWAHRYMPLCEEFVPQFPVVHIGLDTRYAHRFMGPEYDSVGFNLRTQALYLDTTFIDSAHKAKRSVLAWTVNEEDWMRWCIMSDIDAVITDDPAKFNKVKERWKQGQRSAILSWRSLFSTFIMFIMILIKTFLLWRRGHKQRRKR